MKDHRYHDRGRVLDFNNPEDRIELRRRLAAEQTVMETLADRNLLQTSTNEDWAKHYCDGYRRGWHTVRDGLPPPWDSSPEAAEPPRDCGDLAVGDGFRNWQKIRSDGGSMPCWQHAEDVWQEGYRDGYRAAQAAADKRTRGA